MTTLHPISDAGDAAPIAPPSSPPPRPASPPLLRSALRCGAVAAAATAGVMVGFARHAGDAAAAPFAITGRMLLGVAATDGALVRWGATAAGLLLHGAIVVAWAIGFAAVVRRWRGGPAIYVTAVPYAAAAFLVSRWLPALLRLGHGVRALPLQIALLYAVLAVGLGVGMRLAFSADASPPAASHS